ncbi:MAG: ferritin-like domain-containing protein [Firmicutes bacterium]|nr:ferritin-like domain-containing protein [Bacillota bacterium]
MADAKQAVELLQKDIAQEHQATVQYLIHAWLIPSISDEIEGIAREEMRHWEWLSMAVVALGGQPTLARDPLVIEPESAEVLLTADAEAERLAIDSYEADMEQVESPDLQHLFRRIQADERVHRGLFLAMLDEVRHSETVVRPADPAPDAEQLNRVVADEYRAVLAYLYQAFCFPEDEVRHFLIERAVEEMKHLAWAGEHVVALGGRPDFTLPQLPQWQDGIAMLRWDLEHERSADAFYGEIIAALRNEQARSEMERARSQERFHIYEF